MVSSSLVSRWCTCTVITVSRFLRSFLPSVGLCVMVIISLSSASAFLFALLIAVLSLRAIVSAPCMSAVHRNCTPRSEICAGWPKMNCSSSCSNTALLAILMMDRIAICMPSTRLCSHTSMFPTAITGLGSSRPSTSFTNFTHSFFCENISSIFVLSTLSNVTSVSESNKPLWKCGVTACGSLPSDKISSSVGSETK